MKIDFYTQIHKAIRRLLFQLSNRLAAANFNNDLEIQSIKADFLQISSLLRSHAEHEEAFFHPLIEKKLTQQQSQLHSDHQEHEIALTMLENQFNALAFINIDSERKNQGLALYKTYNCFIAAYLLHLNEEETLMPLLHQVCSEIELQQAIYALISHLTDQEVIDSMEYMLPALNPEERFNMMQAMLAKHR